MQNDEDLARETQAISAAQETLLRAAISNKDQACFNACQLIFDWMKKASKDLAGYAAVSASAEAEIERRVSEALRSDLERRIDNDARDR